AMARHAATAIRFLVLPALAAGLYLAVQTDNTHACSMVANPTMEWMLDRSSVVAEGKILDVREITDSDGGPVYGGYRAGFAVQRYYKGNGPTHIELENARVSTCPLFLDPAMEGAHYVLFLGEDETGNLVPAMTGNFSAGQTGRLNELMAVTGPGEPPEDATGGASLSMLIIVVAVTSSAIASLLIVLAGRRRSSLR
ncbi:MAG: hypothetical protein WD533_00615, partial [Dehalococcoidia bacterium]